MNYRVVITPDAEQDLRDAFRYIKARGAPLAARRWLAGARKAIKSLAHNPLRTHDAPESAAIHERIGELLYGYGNRGTYRILFTVIGNKVYVLHVRHGSMAPLVE